MANVSVLIKIIFILSLINSYSASLCYKWPENDYQIIEIDTPINLDLQHLDEICLKYKLQQSKKFIGLSFLKGNSYTVEVFIYDSYEKIKEEKGHYISYIDSFVIGLKDFKEVDVTNFNDSMYLIVKQNKYYYYDYMKLYDSEVSFPLKENTPKTITQFLSNKQYNFVFNSEKNITISYSSKIKGKKKFLLYKNEKKSLYETDNNDIIINSISSNLNITYRITIEIASDEKILIKNFPLCIMKSSTISKKLKNLIENKFII